MIITSQLAYSGLASQILLVTFHLSSVGVVRGKKFTTMADRAPESLILDCTAAATSNKPAVVLQIVKWMKEVAENEEDNGYAVPNLEEFWEEKKEHCDRLEFIKKEDGRVIATLWKIDASYECTNLSSRSPQWTPQVSR